MEKKNIFYIIIGLLCLLVILVLLSRNLLPITENKQFIPESLVKITGEALISYSENDEYKYIITIPAEIEYTGKWEIDNKAISSVDVVSFISFKGVDKKAYIDGENTFLLSKSNPKFEGELSAVIESYAGPIKPVGNYYDDKMMTHESVLLTTETDEGGEGNFLVTLEGAEPTNIEVFVYDPSLGYPLGIGRLCAVKFFIECETDKRYADLHDWIFCEDEDLDIFPREYGKCERYFEICDGEVHIKLIGPTICEHEGDVMLVDTNQVIIEAEGGKPFEPGERVEVSFWRSSDCIDKYDNFDELLSHCTRDFLGYTSLKGVIVVV